jgi:hypothetical protein
VQILSEGACCLDFLSGSTACTRCPSGSYYGSMGGLNLQVLYNHDNKMTWKFTSDDVSLRNIMYTVYVLYMQYKVSHVLNGSLLADHLCK